MHIPNNTWIFLSVIDTIIRLMSRRLVQTVHAGLGNQLFQYSFINYAAKELKVNEFNILKPRFTYTSDRPFELQKLLEFTPNFANYQYLDLKKYLNELFDLLNLDSRLRFCYRMIYEDQPFKLIDLSELKERQLGFYGYFQNYNYVDISWGEIQSSLNVVVNLNSRFSIQYPVNSYNVIHIRSGDINEETINSMGTLSYRYYDSIDAIVNSGLQNIIVTDDIIRANEIKNKINGLGTATVIGKSQMSSWETLAFMKNAKLVIAANSTLSWWGGYLCLKRGGSAIFPDPWFKNIPEASTGLISPFFVTQRSNFI